MTRYETVVQVEVSRDVTNSMSLDGMGQDLAKLMQELSERLGDMNAGLEWTGIVRPLTSFRHESEDA